MVAEGDGWAGAAERGFRLDFAGAKTNRRLFRAAASRPVTDGHESSPDRPQSGIIEKSGGYFCVGTRQNSNESLCTTSCGRRARQGDCGKGLEGRRRRCNVRWEEGERVQGSGFRMRDTQAGEEGPRGCWRRERGQRGRHRRRQWFFLKSNLCILTSFVGPDLAFAGGGGVVA